MLSGKFWSHQCVFPQKCCYGNGKSAHPSFDDQPGLDEIEHCTSHVKY